MFFMRFLFEICEDNVFLSIPKHMLFFGEIKKQKKQREPPLGLAIRTTI